MGKKIPLDPTKTGKEADKLREDLSSSIVGQNDAIEQIVSSYQLFAVGLHAPRRPVGVFLFLGPTGSGKTYTVEMVAKSLVGTPLAVIKIDCAEFQHSHEIAKLIGSPPGYLGHRETHPFLTQERLNQYHTEQVKLSFVLFDEIEKANDALWNLLLGILDKATLTLGDNRQVDFSQSMIFMTSNLGVREMENLMNPKYRLPGVEGSKIKSNGSLNRTGIEAARRKFTPEFMNRIDKIVVFKPLGDKELRRILDLELSNIQARILFSSSKCYVLSVSDEAKNLILSEGTDARYGARHLKRAIERLIVQPLANLIASGQLKVGDTIYVETEGEKLTFSRASSR